ncbi:MAG: hypothetical protein ABIR24_12005 [Verrucomicrobiota bacterium]
MATTTNQPSQILFQWKFWTAVFVVLLLWIIPLVRCLRYVKTALENYTGAIHDQNDLEYGYELLFAYFLCFTLSSGMVYFAFRFQRVSLWLCLGIPLFAVVDVIRIKPEEVVVLIPSMNPFRPIRWNLLALAIAGLIIWLPRYFHGIARRN